MTSIDEAWLVFMAGFAIGVIFATGLLSMFQDGKAKIDNRPEN